MTATAPPTMPPACLHVNARGQAYYLHGKEVTLQSGRRQQIYYFAREVRPGEAMAAIPAGYRVVESPRTGVPFLKRDSSE